MNNFTKDGLVEFLILAGRRALWTFAEVALSMIVIGMPFSSIDWKSIIDVAFGAAIVSLLKSIVVSMPEYANDGEVSIGDTTCRINLGIDEEKVKEKKFIRLKVVPDDTKK